MYIICETQEEFDKALLEAKTYFSFKEDKDTLDCFFRGPDVYNFYMYYLDWRNQMSLMADSAKISKSFLNLQLKNVISAYQLETNAIIDKLNLIESLYAKRTT
jgi:hypothetical protein